MTTEKQDMYSTGTSNCCDAKVYADLGICSDCKEHCDTIRDLSVKCLCV